MVQIEEINDEHISLTILDDSSAETGSQDENIYDSSEQQQEKEEGSAVPEYGGRSIRKFFAGNRQYMTELLDLGTHLCIELYLREDSSAGRPETLLQCRKIIEKPILAPMIDARNAYDVSLSYDASWLSLVDATTSYLQKPETGDHPAGLFRIYEVIKTNPLSSVSSCQSPVELRRSAAVENLPGLSNYYGDGKFHIADDDDDDNVEKEVFIVCNGASVQVYSIYGGWKYLHTISLDHPERATTRFNITAEMMSSLQGRLFAWIVYGTDMIALYDMLQGSMVSSVIRTCLDRSGSAFKTAVDISDNGVLLAVCREGLLTTHFTKSGKLHEVLHLPPEFSDVRSLGFILGNRQLMISTRHGDTSEGIRSGLIINVEDFSILGTFNIPSIGASRPLGPGDLNITPYHPVTLTCDDTCQSALSPLHQHPTETTSSGLHFQVKLQSTIVVLPWEPQDLRSVIVTVTSLNTLSSRSFIIPPACDHEDWWLYKTAVFFEDRGQLVVEGQGVVLIWRLPTSYEDDFSLIYSSLVRLKSADWATCPHHQLYYRQGTTLEDLFNIHSQLAWTPIKTEVGKMTHPKPDEMTSQEKEDFSYFVVGMIVVIYTSLQASDEFKRAVFQYVDRYMSVRVAGQNVLALVVGNWSPENYDSLEQFMEAFMASPFGVMHPTVESVSYVRLVLVAGRKEPRSIGIARVLIDMCIKQARTVMDLKYLVQIMRSLPELLDPKQPHSVLALHTLRRLAYFPASSRKFTINHHTIAYPPTFQLWPWRRHKRPLYLCQDPILQMSGKRTYDPQNDNFTRQLFVAQFDMLWDIRREGHSDGAGSNNWARQLLHAVLFKLTPKRNVRVKCYAFTLEMLDNPALAALVEYKWNTIGFKYWLVRFFCQCCFYLLVLVTVLMQAYDSKLQSSKAMYIAITSGSAIFLYLELIQCFKGWAYYFNSMYNVVDLLAFGFPLAAAVNQLLVLCGVTLSNNVTIQLNAVFFGFSVPLVALHFMFELRVLKTVSQFVVIITRIISRIRVFFIIFFAGLIAFTVAILHVVRPCLNSEENCDNPTKFPHHFFKAFTATYFLMGGRYDPITDDLGSDNWAFHILMIAYFFFTVILMLNVLIALLNVAFNNGDLSWQQVWLRNRMRVVENAENMSYEIPGFREAHNWFPKEIYYSVTHEETKACKKRWAEGEGGDEYVPVNQGAQAVSSPEAGMGISTTKYSVPRPATPSSEANNSPNGSDASHNATEGLDLGNEEQGDSLRSQFVKLEKQMQQQQASFETQIREMGTQFRQQQALFQQLQESSNEQMRLLVEFTRLHSTTSAQS
ncbi:hypothetical protein EC991_002814 [Linnemannia zychae]|nr:hypothetical protein EC991_002814 [Linnemannia zychae]